MKVVCISEISGHGKTTITHRLIFTMCRPLKGQIYRVIGEREYEGCKYLRLEEFPIDQLWKAEYFRPVDDTFGPAVCERIEEQIEYEKAVEV